MNTLFSLQEPLLQQIAKATDGEYLHAEDSQELIDIYRKIDLQLTTKGEDTEVTSYLAMASALLLCAGAALTIRWFGRVP